MCTNLKMRAEDGSIVVGRTMEFATDLGWKLLVAPRGSAFEGTAPSGTGRTWSAVHGVVGVSALGRHAVTDGMNEVGLYAGLLYLPGLASYEEDGDDAARMISPDEAATYVLSTCATVTEAIHAIESVVVWNRAEEALGGGVLPIHLVLHDRTGDFAVVEWIGGVRAVHRSPIGVCTNNPPYDWHITNLQNYVNLSATNVAPVVVDGATIAPLGQGSGLLGLPGDWTPPSRFVRAAAISAATFPALDGPSAVVATLHMLNTFDIPVGLVRDADGDDSTQWMSVADLTGSTYLLRSYRDPTPRQVRLDEIGLDAGSIRVLDLPDEPNPLPFVI
jgi:choloylglycine hydrolase